jgi:response regulator RpfG family c-di-GMP phosphodiesterase
MKSGSHFDPEVVDAFLAEFSEFAAVAERYIDAADTTDPAQ